MTQEEEQLAIGRMVMGRKALREQVAALAGEVDRATKELQTVAGLLSNYRDRDTYSEPLNLSPGAVELLNVPKLTAFVEVEDENSGQRYFKHVLSFRLWWFLPIPETAPSRRRPSRAGRSRRARSQTPRLGTCGGLYAQDTPSLCIRSVAFAWLDSVSSLSLHSLYTLA